MSYLKLSAMVRMTIQYATPINSARYDNRAYETNVIDAYQLSTNYAYDTCQPLNNGANFFLI